MVILDRVPRSLITLDSILDFSGPTSEPYYKSLSNATNRVNKLNSHIY